MTITGVTPAAVAISPYLAVDDVAWAAHPGRDSNRTSQSR